MDAAHALVRAMIHGCLDCSNSLLAGLPTGQMSRLQSVLRATTRLVLGLHGRVPVSVAMHDTLHWLSFPERVTFKLCLLTYKCLHGLAPDYLSRFCTLLTSIPGRPLLRSADTNKLMVPRSCTASMGVGTNLGVGGRRGEARRAESGGWGSWGGDSQLLPTN